MLLNATLEHVLKGGQVHQKLRINLGAHMEREPNSRRSPSQGFLTLLAARLRSQGCSPLPAAPWFMFLGAGGQPAGVTCLGVLSSGGLQARREEWMLGFVRASAAGDRK